MVDIINELGTDINSSWTFTDGDLDLITNNENLSQATANRLNTRQDSIDYFYNNYGSILHRFHGWRKNNTTLKFMEIALRQCLEQDPRYVDFELNLELLTDGKIKISIHSIFDEETEMDMDYVLDSDGTVEES